MMDTITQVSIRLEELGRTSPLSSSDKQEIEDLYLQVLDKSMIRTNCNDCYNDAVIEMKCYLNRNGKMKEKSLYRVKNGILLQMEFGSSEFYTNETLTDEVAEKYLAKYPDNANYFSELPKDWQERVAKRKTANTVTINDEQLELMKESLKDGITAQSVVKEFADYKIDGKKVNKKVLTAHVNQALEEVAEEPLINDEEESSEDEKSPTQTKE